MGRRDQEKPSARLHPAGSWREVGNDPTGLRPGLGKAVAQAEGGRDGLMAKVEVRGPRGRCLDGSFPVYYFARGKERSKWIVFLQGGDWCTRYALTGTKDSRRSCVARSRTKDGSTYRKGPHKSLEKVGEVYGELSPSPGRNPLMHRWNKVYVQNCDATSFSSSLDEEVEAGGRRLHFRGLAVIEEVVSDLLDNRGMGEATDVVLAGCSAGGLAVYLHADRVREAVLEKAAKLGRPKEEVDAIKVVGLADSGFFTPGEQVEGDCDFAGRMSFLYNELNGSAAASPLCVASAGPDEGHRCLLAENAIRFSRTPIFTAQSISDGWQLEWIACNATASSEAGIRHRQRVLESLEAAVGGPIAGGGSTVGKRHGAFIDGCQHHCHCYQDLRVGGVSQAEAFSRFYAAAWTPQGAEGDQEVVWKAETCQMELNKGYSPDCPYKPFAWEH